MESGELKKLFYNMYASKPNAWNAISKRFAREDLSGKKREKREAMEFPAFDKLIRANQKAYETSKNKKEQIYNNPKSIRINDRTLGQVDKQKATYEKPREVKFVDSEAVKDFKYDKNNKLLEVSFQGGDKSYAYPNVPQKVVDAFYAAPSKGTFVNQVISNYSDYNNPLVQKKMKS